MITGSVTYCRETRVGRSKQYALCRSCAFGTTVLCGVNVLVSFIGACDAVAYMNNHSEGELPTLLLLMMVYNYIVYPILTVLLLVQLGIFHQLRQHILPDRVKQIIITCSVAVAFALIGTAGAFSLEIISMVTTVACFVPALLCLCWIKKNRRK